MPGPYNRPMHALERAGLWVPVLLWAGLIFVLSSIPDLATGLGTLDLVLRKVGHFLEYAVLGALLFRAVGREPVALLLGSLYAATDEIHQAFVPGRLGSPLDWLIDTAGAAAGVLVLARTR
jgi:VanZ family protein